ncbi:MAG TPA: NFACT RNA binding domain-containing protein [Longimicrobiales bacterium]|nr:NFACT RNA binding domain-containing protein [Longimicrobiales bacterium]
MRIQWDSALVGATAAALDRRFGGSRIRAVHLDPDARRLSVFLREATLVWELHPERAGFRVAEPLDPPEEARRLPARLVGVTAPPDDRILILETRRIRGRPPRGRIVLELIPNRENAVITEGDDDTVRALLRTVDGDRPLRRGRPWTPPPPTRRAGAAEPLSREAWDRILAEVEAGVPRGRIAWASGLSAPLLDGPDGHAGWLKLRARVLASGDEEGAAVVQGRFGPQPYPLPLPDRTLEVVDDLLEAFRRTGELSDDATVPATLPGHLLQALEERVERARNRAARLQEELDGLGDPDERQGWGDLLLARFHLVPEGKDEVTLEGFDGMPVRIPLDPTLTPDANARRHYDRAARIRRARETLPDRIRQARAAWDALEALLERARTGEADRAEMEAAVPDRDSGPGASDAPSLPYRRYRSSGGLEIRVGRGARRNDDLTFHHSAPDDVWLHARHTAGAHVVLRWGKEGNPPNRDLREAAVLAALHSKARTSGSVPVDWTRRKYVRKPRKAGPGSVTVDRVETVFVAPDPGLEERLRDDGLD